ncbi:helix-turn-helix domain-containing protein [Actinomadura sp. DSM 109109]|nr:helix-turn-helix domain-containing protein [Actinomadura lepetitiana]
MPIVRDPIEPKLSIYHFLAFYLRFLREKSGLSLTQVGKIIGVARSSVCNMEAGRQRPQEDHVAKLDQYYGTGKLLQLLLWFARLAHDPNWFRQYSEYEKQASAIRVYHGQAVPLALQTEEYTRALVEAGSTRDIEGEIAERAQRKAAILDREDFPDLWVIMDEGVMARLVGGEAVMAAQLRHLLKMADETHVSLRIVPFSSGATVGVDGSLQIMRLEARDVAYAGAQGGGRLIESPSDVRQMGDKFERIGVKALSEDGSREIIKKYLEMYA